MREIKFRAWDTKIMSYDGFSIEAVGRAYWFGDFMEEMGELGDSCTLMQYTGLKDKNGKEIYEGDIVVFEYKGEDDPPEIVYWDDNAACWWIKSFNYENRKWEVDLEFWDGCFKDEAMEHFRIIGNIYENPELLSTP